MFNFSNHPSVCVWKGLTSTNDEQCRTNVIDRPEGGYQRYEYTNPQEGQLYETVNATAPEIVYENADCIGLQ